MAKRRITLLFYHPSIPIPPFGISRLYLVSPSPVTVTAFGEYSRVSEVSLTLGDSLEGPGKSQDTCPVYLQLRFIAVKRNLQQRKRNVLEGAIKGMGPPVDL